MSHGGARATEELVALIPAAGFAERMGELPCSKELLPLGWRSGDGAPAPEAEPLAAGLLSRLALGGIDRALMVVRHEKTDIPARLGDGGRWGIEIDYLRIAATDSSVETLDAAYPQVRGKTVALGFPDILFRPADAYAEVVERRRELDADCVLGLFPCDQPERSDMVELRPDGSVERLRIKQPDRGLRYTWSIAVWSSAFTEHLHRFATSAETRRNREVYVGDVVEAAIERGLAVVTVPFPNGESTDLGTPGALANPPRWAT